MTDKELYELCQQYGKQARKWKNKFVALLPEVYKRRLYKKKKFCSIHEFAAKVGGVSRGVVDEALRLGEKFKETPKLLELRPEVGISKLRAVAGVVTKETESFWTEKVQNMTRGSLETLIRDTRQERENKIIDSQKIPGDGDEENEPTRQRFGMDLDEETIFQLKLIKQKFEKEKGEPLCWDEVMKMAAKELLVEKSVREYKTKPSKSRAVPAKKRREQPKKCVVPGCKEPAQVIHHPERYAITKNHDRLASMCKAHHELAHRGYVDEQHDFEIRVQPVVDPIKQFVDQKMLGYLRGT